MLTAGMLDKRRVEMKSKKLILFLSVLLFGLTSGAPVLGNIFEEAQKFETTPEVGQQRTVSDSRSILCEFRDKIKDLESGARASADNSAENGRGARAVR